jgi:hypothetical protein
MVEIKDNVLIGKRIVAKDMTLENAVIFLKGLFNEYYNDPMLSVTIELSKENLVSEDENKDAEDFWLKDEEQ